MYFGVGTAVLKEGTEKKRLGHLCRLSEACFMKCDIHVYSYGGLAREGPGGACFRYTIFEVTCLLSGDSTVRVCFWRRIVEPSK